MSEYCRKCKGTTDVVANLGSLVEDRFLTLNILQGLNQRFKHLGSIIHYYLQFPTFLKVRDDLLLEEIHLGPPGLVTPLTMLYSNSMSSCPKPSSYTPSCSGIDNYDGSTNFGNGRSKGNNPRNNDNDEQNDHNGGRGGSTNTPAMPPLGARGTNDKGLVSWTMYFHPW